MIDLSKHIQEGARLELEAMERLAEECSFCSSMSAQHNAQAMRIDELQAEIGRLRLDALTWYKRVHDLEDEIANWKSWGVIEVAIRNQNVSSSMKHWEERAEKAEAELSAFREQLAERDAELAAAKAAARLIKDDGDRELAALKGHAEELAAELELMLRNDRIARTALDAYRAAYPKEADK